MKQLTELKNKQYFYFTQNSLNTFKNCPFKFKKKYIDNIKWKDDKDDSSDEHIKFGTDFHKIAERYFSDIPVFEESFADDAELYSAFCNLRDYFPINSEYKYYPEYSIRYSDGNVRLEANLDLIIEKGDSVEILDWKTNAKDDEKKYANSLQTQIYMYVLKKCCKNILGKNIDKIKMSYFSPERKKIIADITYSEEKYIKDEKEITKLIENIYNFDWEKFNKELYEKHCKFCEFNLFCSSSKNTDVKYEFGELDWDSIDELY